MPRKQHTHHYIYKTTCNVTGKYYIGMHSTSNLEDGYIGSGQRLWKSIKKHGRENHSTEILEWLPDRSSLKLREKEIVNEELLTDPMCMNLALGGEGGNGSLFLTKDQLRKGAINMNLKNWNDETFKKRQSTLASDRNKKLHALGILKAPNWKGKTHSTESKLKMSMAAKSKSPEKNSQFGTIWITNESDNRKIKRGDFLPEGWRYGRVIKKSY